MNSFRNAGSGSVCLWGGQSWPQPPFRRPEPAKSRLRAELPALQIPKSTHYRNVIALVWMASSSIAFAQSSEVSIELPKQPPVTGHVEQHAAIGIPSSGRQSVFVRAGRDCARVGEQSGHRGATL